MDVLSLFAALTTRYLQPWMFIVTFLCKRFIRVGTYYLMCIVVMVTVEFPVAHYVTIEINLNEN